MIWLFATNSLLHAILKNWEADRITCNLITGTSVLSVSASAASQEHSLRCSKKHLDMALWDMV